MEDSANSTNIDFGTQMIPVFKYELAEYWEPDSDGGYMLITPEQNKKLYDLLGNFESLCNISSDLANTLKAMYDKEKLLVADIDAYTRMMIDTGRFTFTRSRDTGDLLPTLRDSKRIVKQIRLKEMYISPELAQSISNLQTHAAIAMVMKAVEQLNISISRINQMMWNNLIGESKGAWQLLMNALESADIEDRRARIRNAMQIATVNRTKLEENFAAELKYILEHTEKNKFNILVDFDGVRHVEEKAENLIHIYAVITNDARVEVAGNIIMNQPQAAIKSIKQYQSFLKKNQLEDDNMLYLINECCKVDMKSSIEQFGNIRVGMEKNIRLLSSAPELLLEDGNKRFKPLEVITEDVDSKGNEEHERKYCKKCKRQLSVLSTTTKCYHCRSKLIKKLQNGTSIALGVLGTIGAVVASKSDTDDSQENENDDE